MKIEVEICCGTACYLLGASQMVDIENDLPDGLKDSVEIIPRTCLGLCERDNIGKAPYVRFNKSEVMCEATEEKVISRIRELAAGTKEA
ncbi:MAG: hypothetical protein IKD42_01870 [Kiritimatiellae bacterium]|nr:hypothetical protein [Kiritimatiellia bacterium]